MTGPPGSPSRGWPAQSGAPPALLAGPLVHGAAEQAREELPMVFDVSVAMTWLLYLALFPMAFFWLRRAWRILVKRDFREVAIKRGESPADPARWAPYAMAINALAGTVAGFVIVGVGLGQLAYDTWTAIAGTTIWSKFLLDFALSRHAHGFGGRTRA